MIENVIAIATRASGVFWITRFWTVWPFNQPGCTTLNATSSAAVMSSRNHVSM